jgi:hypothetical protein
MNLKLVVALAAVLVAGAGAAIFFALRRAPLPPLPPAATAPSAHASGMDRAMAAANALYHAPEGSTPCETAYNALKSSDDLARREHVTPVVLRLAPREEFLARCGALPPATQQCLVPVYLRSHREDCARSRPSPDVLKAIVELRQAAPAEGLNEPLPMPPLGPPK